MAICCLCNEGSNETFDIFSESGVRLKVFSILSKHFSFLQICNNGTDDSRICKSCWTVIQDFNKLYEKMYRHWSNFASSSSATPTKTNVHCEPDFFIKMETSEKPYIKFESPNKSEVILDRADNDYDRFNDPMPIDEMNYSNSASSQVIDESSSYRKRVVNKKQRKIDEKPKQAVDNKKPDPTDIGIYGKELRPKNNVESDKMILDHFSLDCNDCSHSSTTFSNFMAHSQQVHKKRGYVYCCDKKFSKRSEMLDHIALHSDPESFKCHECNKLFATKCSHRYHMESHVPSNERQFKCAKCSLSFSKLYMLNQHIRRIHTDQIFSCEICGKTFNAKNSVKAHVINTHVNKSATATKICHICAKTYKSKASLQLHIMEIHNFDPDRPKLRCTICGACFSNELYLKRHTKRHTESNIKCSMCDKVSPSKSALHDHMKYKHLKHTHKCSICEKTFARPLALKEHMASHTGEDLYSCQLCIRTFKSRANMHSHRKRVHPASNGMPTVS